MSNGHDDDCPWSNPETAADNVTAGLPCTCKPEVCPACKNDPQNNLPPHWAGCSHCGRSKSVDLGAGKPVVFATSHREQLLCMLNGAGVEVTHHDEEGLAMERRRRGDARIASGFSIDSTEGHGYVGFFSDWYFDAQGSLIAVGHYE